MSHLCIYNYIHIYYDYACFLTIFVKRPVGLEGTGHFFSGHFFPEIHLFGQRDSKFGIDISCQMRATVVV